jgi:hypothetical protein
VLYFDLDGTLVDTHELVLLAYEAAGVPRDVVEFGVPAVGWLLRNHFRPNAVAKVKNIAYAALIKERGVKTLPAFDVFMSLKPGCRGICTGASAASVRSVLSAVGVAEWQTQVSSSVAAFAKPMLLEAMGARGYVDDDESTRQGCQERMIEWFHATTDIDRMTQWTQLRSYSRVGRTSAFR